MTEMSKLSICMECNWKNKHIYYQRVTAFGSVLLFTIFCILPAFSVYGQDAASTSRRENRASRQQKQVTAQTLDHEIQETSKTIPWSSFTPQAKAKVRSVVLDNPLFRRLPQQVVHADPEIFQFLSEHPDLVVGFWERLGITQLSIKELKKEQFAMKETSGTAAVAEVVYRTKDTCIVYAKGQYKGPLLAKTYDGSVVLILRSRFMRDADNEPVIICDLDAFVRIENLGVDFIAKLFSTTLGKIADSNFEQTIAFVGYVSESVGINADSLKRAGYQVKGVRDEVQEDFADVVERAAMRIAHRNNPGTLESVSHYAAASKFSPSLLDTSFDRKLGSEQVKQEFTNVFHADPFFTVRDVSEEPKEKSQTAANTDVTEVEEYTELTEPIRTPIPIAVSTLNQENMQSDIETAPKNRVIFTTPKIAR